jgi:hypothetical protein
MAKGKRPEKLRSAWTLRAQIAKQVARLPPNGRNRRALLPAGGQSN